MTQDPPSVRGTNRPSLYSNLPNRTSWRLMRRAKLNEEAWRREKIAELMRRVAQGRPLFDDHEPD